MIDYRGIAILIITVSICAAVLVTIVGAVWMARPIEDKGLEALSSVLLVLAGCVTTYIGQRYLNGSEKK